MVYPDNGFYDGKCLTLLHTYNFAYVLPIIWWGRYQGRTQPGMES